MCVRPAGTLLAPCSGGFRFLAQYISFLEFAPASNEPTFSMLGQKKEFFEKPPFRPVSSEAPQNTIWHVLKKCGTMFQKYIYN